MGWFDAVRTKFSEWGDALDKQFSQLNNAKFANAVTAAAVLVATADGNFSQDEMKKIAGVFKNSPQLKKFDATDLKAKLDAWVEKFEKAGVDFAAIEAYGAVAKLKGDAVGGPALIRYAVMIGGSDGNFDEKEKAIVKQMAKELGLNPGDISSELA